MAGKFIFDFLKIFLATIHLPMVGSDGWSYLSRDVIFIQFFSFTLLHSFPHPPSLPPSFLHNFSKFIIIFFFRREIFFFLFPNNTTYHTRMPSLKFFFFFVYFSFQHLLRAKILSIFLFYSHFFSQSFI